LCCAETIHLKNGRTITADTVREKDGRIEYEVRDNIYRIPKSLVERIDNSSAPLPDPETTSATIEPSTAADARKDTPPLPGVKELKLPGTSESLQIIRHGKVDIDALNALELLGRPEVTAAGYFIAGRFEFDRGNRESARRYFERALGYSPDNAIILANHAALLVQLGRAREAINFAQHAVQVAPDSADSYTALGYAYSGADRTRDAVAAWERSLELRQDARVERLLAKAKRELVAEVNFSEHDTGRFTLRYEGTATKDTLRRQIVATLEKNYDELSNELGIVPYQNIPVVLYTEKAFFDVTQAPSWSGALNDGKLRIPVQGLDFISPELARVLKHELAHSFINQASAGRCPQWLNEGIAQVVESRSLDARGYLLAQLYKSESQIPLAALERSFMGLSGGRAALAYDESLAAAVYIRETYGMSDLRRLLEHLSQGGTTEEALRAVLRTNYKRFEQDLADFLIHKYGS
jgi:tetratricopeptide (TPR) repeat protein